jgi:hypothetical protein
VVLADVSSGVTCHLGADIISADVSHRCGLRSLALAGAVSGHEAVDDLQLTPARVSHLLGELCTKLGFCLPIGAQRRLVNSPPRTIDRFTDVVITMEGLQPDLCNVRQNVRELVKRHFAAARRGMESRSVADVEGPWLDSDFESSLIQNCRRFWATPVPELPNDIVAMFLRQKIALELMIPEAHRRLESGYDDGSEWYEGQLAEALNSATD